MLTSVSLLPNITVQLYSVQLRRLEKLWNTGDPERTHYNYPTDSANGNGPAGFHVRPGDRDWPPRKNNSVPYQSARDG
jgi:hypothetical protein